MRRGDFIALDLLGIVFLLAGGIIILNSLQGITGAVVFANLNISNGYYIGIWFILGGFSLLFISARLEHHAMYAKPVENVLAQVASFGGNAVIDTSSLRAAWDANQLGYLLKGIGKAHAFVPKQVADELRNPALLSYVREHSTIFDPSPEALENAKQDLERTEKSILRKKLLPILRGEEKLGPRNAQAYKEGMEMVAQALGSGIYKLAKVSPTQASAKIIRYLDVTCAPSDADAAVAAFAKEKGFQQPVTIIADDTHLRDFSSQNVPGRNVKYVRLPIRQEDRERSSGFNRHY